MALFNETIWFRKRSALRPDEWHWEQKLEPSFTQQFWKERRIRLAGKDYECSHCKRQIRKKQPISGGWRTFCFECTKIHFNNLADAFENYAMILRSAILEDDTDERKRAACEAIDRASGRIKDKS